ncbi:unnamed protein product [Rotaria socialis]|uniref:Uncharacterized protein n=1 Tax=Rotaria socialis TaxID=392032 RepID=A0A817U4J0_9BILA|nr:unnamed protein product [Rotaria socialis]CAF3411984.1 unnamed protein product [Rotaria socialis]
MKEYKVVVLGPGGVGKSALTDFYRKEIEVDSEPAYLEILDTAGTEQFASMRDLYIKNGRGFLVVFSLTSWQSFVDIRTMREQILRVKGTDNVPICLIGNKCDASLQRQVTPDDALELAQAWSCPYIETSAKLAINVNDTFAEIVREINARIKTKKSRKKKKKYRRRFLNCCSSP